MHGSKGDSRISQDAGETLSESMQGNHCEDAYYQRQDQKYTCRKVKMSHVGESTICQAAGWDTIVNAQKRKLARPIAHPVHGIISRLKDRGNTQGGFRQVGGCGTIDRSQKKRKSYKGVRIVVRSSGEDLDHTIAAATDDPASVTAPDGGADTFATH